MPSKTKAIGMLLTDGKNVMYAEAYRERAGMIENLHLQKGDLVQVQISSSVKSREKDGVTYYSNNLSIDTCLLLVKSAS